MRTISRIFLKILALLLTFLLGFATCIAAIVGVAFLVYSKVSIDVVNDTGLVHIDTSKVIDPDEAEVLLTSLTIEELLTEFQDLKDLGDDATIDLLVERYGLILSEEIDDLLNEDMRKIPVFKLTSSEGMTMILKAQTVGSVLGYDKVPNPDYTDTNGKEEFLWLENGEEVGGINGVLADYSLYKLLSDGIDTSGLSEELTIASILDLSSRNDFEIFFEEEGVLKKAEGVAPITIWYNNDGTRTDKIISSVASSTFSDVGKTFESLYIADVIGYVYHDGSYYSYDVKYDGTRDYITLTKQEGITSEFADLTVKAVADGGLDDKVSDIELYKVLGYTLGKNGKFYDENGAEVTGIMAVLADDKVGEIGANVGLITVGEVAGYTNHKGVWYSTFVEEGSAENVEAKGILAALSDLTVDEMTDEALLSAKVQTIAVADVLGYEYDEATDSYTKDGAPVTGVMGVIAGTPVNGIQEKLDSSDMGEIIGFTKKPVPVYAEDGVTLIRYDMKWFDKEGNEVHVLMQKVGNTKFANVGTLTEDLKVSDLIDEKDRQTGFIALVPADTGINEIGSAVGDIFNTKTLGDFIGKGALTFEDPTVANRLIENGFGDYTIPEMITLLVNLDIKAPAK